jgi:class 3 adenylate cyclase
MRAGLHVGEVEIVGEDVRGSEVQIAARVMVNAGPGEVLVSSAVPPLVAGSGIEFADRGEHELRRLPEGWRLFRVEQKSTAG